MSVPEGVKPGRERREGARSPIFDRYAVLSGQAAQGGHPILASHAGYEWLVRDGEAEQNPRVGRSRQYKSIQVMDGLPVMVNLLVEVYDELQHPTPGELAAMPHPVWSERHSHVLVRTHLNVHTKAERGYIRSHRFLMLEGLDDGRIVVKARVSDEPDPDPDPSVEKVQRMLFGNVVDLGRTSVRLANPEKPGDFLSIPGPSQDLTDPELGEKFLKGYTLVINKLEKREKAEQARAKEQSGTAELRGSSTFQVAAWMEEPDEPIDVFEAADAAVELGTDDPPLAERAAERPQGDMERTRKRNAK